MMKNILFLLIALLSTEIGLSQLGCTNILACNYDAGATTDDGSCVVPLAINAGTDIQLYSEYATVLSAMNPDPAANGYWTVEIGPATLDDASTSTTNANNLQLGGNLFRWHQDYSCTTHQDYMIVYVFANPQNTINDFIQFEGEEAIVLHECEATPLPYMSVTDFCAGNPTVEMVSEIVSSEYCRLDTPPLTNNPCDYSEAWSLALFNVPTNERWYQSLDLGYRTMPNGQIHVYGTVYNALNPDAILLLDIWLYDEMNWSEWSSQNFPSSYKADCNGVGANHIDWTYYKLGYGKAIGLGDLTGTSLEFTQLPENMFYGVQLGVGANNTSASFGLGGWLTCNGYFNNAASGFTATVVSTGDLSGEASCCTSELIEVSYSANDDCGHSANYTQSIEIRDNSCGYSCSGCMDEAACNYSPDATEANGSCEYTSCIGCTDAEAANFDSEATINLGCLYYTGIVVFNDENGDGLQQAGEEGLQNWPLYIAALGATIFTNEHGMIDIALPPSPYMATLINNSNNLVNTTPLTQSFVLPSDPEALFGLQVSGIAAYAVNGPYDGYWDIIHCTDGYEAGVHIANTGSMALHGQLILNCDPSFLPQADVFSTIAPDVTAAGYAEWNITNLQTGAVDLFSFHIDGPGIDNIGDDYLFEFHLMLYDENDALIYDNTWATTPIIGCSYDPNDITADPVGYAEPHYILPGERIEFRIRFQNLGNIPAQTVMIHDDINEEVFDITSFQPLYGSASFTACLHDDGMVDFLFEGINLPSAETDEEASHGFVVYSIEAHEFLAPGTMLFNEAFIVFDENAPIQTNEVFHTIFDCNSFTTLDEQVEFCHSEAVVFDLTQAYVETYHWLLNGESISTASTIELPDLQPGQYQVQLTTANPLCDMLSAMTLTIHEQPQITTIADGTVCESESILLNATSDGDVTWSNGTVNGNSYTPTQNETLTATATSEFDCTAEATVNIVVNPLPGIDVTENGALLTAPAGTSWQWYYNSVLMADETNQILEATQSGIYNVITTNAFDCSSQSVSVEVTTVGEMSGFAVVVYPNPAHDQLRVVLPAGIFDIQLFDAAGKLVKSESKVQRMCILHREGLAVGSYQLTVNDGKKTTTRNIVFD